MAFDNTGRGWLSNAIHSIAASMVKFRSYMDSAIRQAQVAGQANEVPVGCVIVGPKGQVLSQAGNQTRQDNDPTAHAEILAIRQACKVIGQDRLAGCDLYVTLEPCAMCAAAIAHARIARVYFGASDPKSGGVLNGARVFTHPQCHHKPEVYDGISEAECAALLVGFFKDRRKPAL
ncbi:MAG: tRNA(adenine34) deaminase [Gammaproteobacteria bacterium]|jgi:tRNA(adenine34) deaminase